MGIDLRALDVQIYGRSLPVLWLKLVCRNNNLTGMPGVNNLLRLHS